jgi:hypothetical protein
MGRYDHLYSRPLERITTAWRNSIVDALNELESRLRGGHASFTGDGATTTFSIPHGLGVQPVAVIVGKGSPGLPDIDYWVADSVNIYVTFKSPPGSGVEVRVWWIAVKPLL